jgi:hypothetical protein
VIDAASCGGMAEHLAVEKSRAIGPHFIAELRPARGVESVISSPQRTKIW